MVDAASRKTRSLCRCASGHVRCCCDSNDRFVTFCRRVRNAFYAASVAEGVKTEEQYRLLQQLGCDTCQGYYFGKPVSAVEFERTFLRPAASS
ncbi:EAL domain-containing protein [Porticoccus sp.]|uniref:EAL domain-containing protein n=1 Tax=Porticoccus sp. TaxID=2024853 RepID=UPI003F699BE6